MLSLINDESMNKNNYDSQASNLSSDFKLSSKYEFGKCKVCGDKATGVHYGVASCEGCKGFFKRSISTHERYICNYGRKCQITPEKRKICKYCRYQICISVGMSMNGIKMGRIPNSEKTQTSCKENLNDPIDISTSTSSSQDGFFKAEDQFGLQVAIKKNSPILKRNDEFFFPSTFFLRDKIINIYHNNIEKNASIKIEPHKLYSIIHNRSTEINSNITLDDVSKNLFKMVSIETLNFVKYAKALPGFDELNILDFRNVIYECIPNCITLSQHNYFVNRESYLFLGKDIQFSKKWITICFGQDFKEKLFDLHEKIEDLNLKKTEMALMIVVMLTSPGIQLVDPSAMRRVHEFYKKLIENEFMINERNDKFYKNYDQCLVIFEDLKKSRQLPKEYLSF